MDDIDLANALADMEREACVARARAVQRRLPPCGTCYYCSEDAPKGASFCTPDCRDDYELEAKLRRQNGGFAAPYVLNTLAILGGGAVIAAALRNFFGG